MFALHTAFSTSGPRGLVTILVGDPSPSLGLPEVAYTYRPITPLSLMPHDGDWLVDTGADIQIAGLTVGGMGTKQVFIQAIGPGLVPRGVQGTLVDPDCRSSTARATSSA